MPREATLAEKALKEIRDTQKKLSSLTPKINWIEKVKKDPNKAANLYFELFEHLIKYYGESDKDWEQISLLQHFGADPLSVKNEEGLNPFVYFYKKNREERLSLHNLSKAYDFAYRQNEMRLMRVANLLYNQFYDLGLSEEQLSPLRKSSDLWKNYQRLTQKQRNTSRVAFSRLLKTVIAHPEDVIKLEELKQRVAAQLGQEVKVEEQAWKKWDEWGKEDYRARFHRPVPGHARGHSSLHMGGHYSFLDEYFLNQPLADSTQKALDDFLLSLKDENIYRRLGLESVLPEKRIKAYKRALNPPKHFERTR